MNPCSLAENIVNKILHINDSVFSIVSKEGKGVSHVSHSFVSLVECTNSKCLLTIEVFKRIDSLDELLRYWRTIMPQLTVLETHVADVQQPTHAGACSVGFTRTMHFGAVFMACMPSCTVVIILVVN